MVKDIKTILKTRLSEDRYIHSLGVEATAIELAIKFGEDPKKASIAGLSHDIAKCIPLSELLKIIEENNLPVPEMEKKSWKALHSPVGAFIAQRDLEITDKDILNSIRWHTIGRIGMSTLEKIIYLADKIEPNREDTDFVNEVKKVLNDTNSLDAAILLTYGATIKSLVERKLFINLQTIEVWNHLLTSIND